MYKKKVAFIIDGWFMRKRAQYLGLPDYGGPNIRNYCKKHLRDDEALFRIYYYDTEPLTAKAVHPLTGDTVDFARTNVAQSQYELLDSIRTTPNFALRLGTTAWRGQRWVIDWPRAKELLEGAITVDDLEPREVRPDITQKAVDMKMGLDISSLSLKRVVEKLVIITGDTDLVPAIKLARVEGLEVGLDPLWQNIAPLLSEHVDYIRTVTPKPQPAGYNRYDYEQPE